jgi:hypothetical protein
MDPKRQLLRLEEELVGLRQLRRYLLERLAGLEENISSKEHLTAALKREFADGERRPAVPDLRYGAVRAAILERLADEPGGMDAGAIGRMLRNRFGDAVHPKSHFNALKRLSDDGLAVREGRIWRLVTTEKDTSVD